MRPVSNCAWLLLGVTMAMPGLLRGQDTTEVPRPFIRGGVYDKPYVVQLKGRTAIGGYVEADMRYQRVDGVLEEFTFVAKRFNLFFSTQVSDLVRFAAELEFENGAEEIKLEFAAVDLILARALTLRGGMILAPLGLFNQSHDSPLNEFVDRPVVSNRIIGVALSEPGLGAMGLFPVGATGRVTYQLFAVNGFNQGLIDDSPDGTRIPEGQPNLIDNNSSPSLVGRVAWSPGLNFQVGLSGHYGAYNVFRVDGQEVAPRENLGIWVIDLEAQALGIRFEGEGTLATIGVPNSLEGIYAERQRGLYVQGMYDFARGWIKVMPRSFFSVGARLDAVDFDADLPGDSIKQLTLGLNFRPTAETVFKFNLVRGQDRDRFNNASDFAAVLFSVATYF